MAHLKPTHCKTAVQIRPHTGKDVKGDTKANAIFIGSSEEEESSESDDASVLPNKSNTRIDLDDQGVAEDLNEVTDIPDVDTTPTQE